MRRAAFLVALLAACTPSHGERVAQTVDATAHVAPAPVPASVAASVARGARAGVVAPMPLVSRGKRTEGWSAARYSDVRRATDGDYHSWWDAGHPTPEHPAWLAIDVGRGPSRLLLTWSSAGSFNYEETDYGSPGAYRVETSADSTDGTDGTWKTAVDVPDVAVHGAEHAVPFLGQRWVKLVITRAPKISPNGVQINEVEVHDASEGTQDCWFFMGDSITAFAFARGPSHGPSFAERIHTRHPRHMPATINGGVGGDKSDQGAARVDDWLARSPDAHFWAIGYGSNDAAGDTTDTAAFRANMEKIVRHVQAAGRVPILARIPYASDGHHAGIPRFNEVIDSIRADHHLPAGPDLYAWFLAHPDELRDGLHPNDKGIASMNRLWAEAAEPLYARP